MEWLSGAWRSERNDDKCAEVHLYGPRLGTIKAPFITTSVSCVINPLRLFTDRDNDDVRVCSKEIREDTVAEGLVSTVCWSHRYNMNIKDIKSTLQTHLYLISPEK